MEPLIQDVRFAIRSLRKAPGFSAIAILTLALGMGAVTAMFSVVDGVLLKPLRYPDADRIVAVVNRYADRTAPNLTGGDEMDVSADHDTFAAFAYYNGGEMGVQLADHAEFVGTRLVHPDFFRVFGVAPVAGRPFTHDDARRSAVVSSGFARRNFGSAAAALGQSVFIENRPYAIVGVMPPEMQFPAGTEVWAAAPIEPANRNRTGHNYRAVARLAAGVPVEIANAHLTALATRLASAFPESNEGKTFVAVPLRDNLVIQARTTLYVLTVAVVLVLLIACANVANLMLARAAGRAREVAVRTALGAGRRQIVSQLLAESVVLAGIASALGLLIAYAGTHALLRFRSQYVPLPRLNDVVMDGRVLLFTAVVSLLTTAAFGLAPALHACRADVRDALSHSGSRGPVGAESSLLRSGLVVVQIALAYVLAIDAGLLLRSFVSLTEMPLGFRTESVLVMYAHAPARGSIFDRSGLDDYLGVGRFFDDLFGRLRQLPGAISAGGAMGLPTGQYDSAGSYAVEGRHSFSGDFRRLPSAGFRLASPGYFATLGIPLRRGRECTEGDIYDRPFVAIVSESLAKQTFGDEDPIGHRVMCGLDQPDRWMTIVGVVGDVRQASPASRPGPELYMPLRQHPYTANEVQIVLRSRVPPEYLIAAVQQTVRSARPDVAMKFTTLEQSVNDSIAAPRFRMMLASTFASVALLAIAGVYSVMSYLTAQRTAEFGLRIALGAAFADVVRLVLVRAGHLMMIGTAIGLTLALASSRIVSTLLFGVTTTDAGTYAGVLLIAMPFVVLAAAIPAVTAARVDPMVALRAE